MASSSALSPTSLDPAKPIDHSLVTLDIELDGSSLPFGSSSALLESLTPYQGDVASWLNNLMENAVLDEVAPYLNGVDATVRGQKPSSPSSLKPSDEERARRMSQVQPSAANLASFANNTQALLNRITSLSQDTSSHLEQTIHDISRTVPRLTYDLQFMREAAEGLRLALSTLSSPASSTNLEQAGPDPKTLAVLERLSYLDTIKTNLEQTRDVLREAESWSTLESEIMGLVAAADYFKAAERLSEASKSVRVFKGTGEEEGRRALMVSLQNTLEATAVGDVVKGIMTRDIESCKTFFEIFGMIGREGEFRNYYYGTRRSEIVKMWNEAHISDLPQNGSSLVSALPSTDPIVQIPNSNGNSKNAVQNFNTFLPHFYSSLSSQLSSERNLISQIFPDPSETLSAFLRSIMDALQPSLLQRLESLTESYGASALQELVSCYKSTEEAALVIQKVFETLEGVQEEHSFFEPFFDFQSSYPSLEKRYLDSKISLDLDRPASELGVDDDFARTLSEKSKNVLGLAEGALERCIAFTHGYGSVGLIEDLNQILSGFWDAARREVESTKGARNKKNSLGRPSTERDGMDELDFEGMDYTSEDWGTFQLGLHLLETCRGVREQLEAFEVKLASSLTQVAGQVNSSRNGGEIIAYPGTTSGAISLLRQSSLNSAELHTLLESLSPHPHTPSHRYSLSTSTTPSTTLLSPSMPSGLSKSLLFKAKNSATALTKASQLFLQATILSPLRQLLVTYASMPVWSQGEKAPRKGALASVPTFSLAPTDTIAKITEGLLNLPRLFEVYTDDDALAFSIESLPFVDVEALAQMQQEANGTHETHRDSVLGPPSPHGRLSPVSPHAHLPSLSAPTSVALPSVMVLSIWLNSLTISLLSELTSTILPSIRSLSTSGSAQLASDLAYLSSVVKVYDVEWEELEVWKEASELNEEAGREKYAAMEEKGPENDADRTFVLIAKMRGWNHVDLK